MELAVIQTQLAYVRQMQGHVQEALGIYRQVLDRKPDDVAVVAVANNNLIAARGKHDKMLDAVCERSYQLYSTIYVTNVLIG